MLAPPLVSNWYKLNHMVTLNQSVDADPTLLSASKSRVLQVLYCRPSFIIMTLCFSGEAEKTELKPSRPARFRTDWILTRLVGAVRELRVDSRIMAVN